MKKYFIFHPFLLAIAPILSLYDHNKDATKLIFLFWPSVIALAAAGIIFGLIYLIIKNKNKAALISSVFIIMFFLFGQIEGLFKFCGKPFAFLVWLIIGVAVSLLIVAVNKIFDNLNKYINYLAVFVVVWSIISISWYEYRNYKTIQKINLDSYDITFSQTEDKPDIYYLVLDAYGRSDVLKEVYNYDNSDFLDFLTDKGFYIAQESHANYPQSLLSISSALNFQYLDNLAMQVGVDSHNRKPLKETIKNNRVYELLDNNGYTFVTMPYNWLEIADLLKSDIAIGKLEGAEDFNDLIKKNTLLDLFIRDTTYIQKLGNAINYSMKNLPEITKIEEPTFIYMHIVSPHPPFIFDQDGNLLTDEQTRYGLDGSHYFKYAPDRNQYREKYKNQAIYISKLAKETIKNIIAGSDTPPIIIVQGDHGPGSMLDWDSAENTNVKERMSILNAYYVPDQTKKMLYPSITPVNSFRIIFDSVYGTNFGTIEDKSYFAVWERPYDFIDVNDRL